MCGYFRAVDEFLFTCSRCVVATKWIRETRQS